MPSGPTKLKNIAEPVRVYSLEVSVAAPLTHAPQAEFATPEPSAWLALPDKPSIAVLAFQNMSGERGGFNEADNIAGLRRGTSCRADTRQEQMSAALRCQSGAALVSALGSYDTAASTL